METEQSTVSSPQELETVTIRSGILPITYCRIGGDWWRYDTPTIMSGLVVRFSFGKAWELARAFEVSASRDEVCIHGGSSRFQSAESIEQLVAIIRVAHLHHQEISRRPWGVSATAAPFARDIELFKQMQETR